MSSRLIQPSVISGCITAPASKSMMQRAVVAALLANDGVTELGNFMDCNDSLAALAVAQGLGAAVRREENTIYITGGLKDTSAILSCGESGLLARLIVPVAATLTSAITVDGEGSLLARPFGFVEQSMQQMGVSCTANRGFLPLTVQGPVKNQQLRVDGSTSSQLVSGLLMALPLCAHSSTIEVLSLNSRPYVDMTVELLKYFGVEVVNDDYRVFHIRGGQSYKACPYTVEGDWSGASSLLVAGAIAGSVRINGLNPQSLQADRAMLEVLRSCGAKILIANDYITVERGGLKSFEFDATQCPDLFPALVALAAACSGVSRINGVSRLRHKESDRAITLQQEFAKLQVPITLSGDIMEITGGRVCGGKTFAHNDHRIAMALAVAGLIVEGSVEIDGAECVEKSYPRFFDDFGMLLGKV